MAPFIACLIIAVSMLVISSLSPFLKLEYALLIFLVACPLLIFIFITLSRYVTGLLDIQLNLISSISLGLSFIALCSTILTLFIFSLNALLNTSPPQKTSIIIIDKSWQGSFGNRLRRAYYVYIPRPETISFPFYFSPEERVRISGKEYAAVTANITSIHLSMQKGFFGIPYYSSYSFDDTQSPVKTEPTDNSDALAACKWTKRFNLTKQIEQIEPDKYIKEFWPNGFPRSVEPMVNGLRHGVARYSFMNGLLEADIPWKHGQKHGVFKTYYDDGSLDKSQSYKNGELYGIQQQFKHDGTIASSTLYIGNGKTEKASICGDAW